MGARVEKMHKKTNPRIGFYNLILCLIQKS